MNVIIPGFTFARECRNRWMMIYRKRVKKISNSQDGSKRNFKKFLVALNKIAQRAKIEYYHSH